MMSLFFFTRVVCFFVSINKLWDSLFCFRSIKIKDKTLYLGCASPVKFSDALEKANIPVPTSYLHYLEKLKTRKEKVIRLPADQNIWLNFVLEYIHENIADKLTWALSKWTQIFWNIWQRFVFCKAAFNIKMKCC